MPTCNSLARVCTFPTTVFQHFFCSDFSFAAADANSKFLLLPTVPGYWLLLPFQTPTQHDNNLLLLVLETLSTGLLAVLLTIRIVLIGNSVLCGRSWYREEVCKITLPITLLPTVPGWLSSCDCLCYECQPGVWLGTMLTLIQGSLWSMMHWISWSTPW